MVGSQEHYAKYKSQIHKTIMLFHLYLILEKGKMQKQKANQLLPEAREEESD